MRQLPFAILALTSAIVATTVIIGWNYANDYLRGAINASKVKERGERQMLGELFLEATMGPYPGEPADPNARVEGTVTAVFRPGVHGSLTLQYNLRGLPHTLCECCGIHIHDGKSCEDHAFVGDHYWNPDVIAGDVWNKEHNACYTTQGDTGFSTGSFGLYTGHGYDDNKFHAVVVHNNLGQRIGCGTLYPTTQNSF